MKKLGLILLFLALMVGTVSEAGIFGHRSVHVTRRVTVTTTYTYGYTYYSGYYYPPGYYPWTYGVVYVPVVPVVVYPAPRIPVAPGRKWGHP